MPRMRVSEELEARLRSEAEQLIPFPLQEVYLDYAMRGADAALTPSAPASAPRAPGADRMDVLLVAARRERVRDLQALAAAVGLQPVAVDVADFAARRAVWHLMARCAPARTRTSGVPTLAVLDLRADRVVWQCLQGDEVVHEGECMREPSGGDDAGEARPEPGVAEALAQALTGFPNDSWSGPGSGPFPGAADGRIEALWLTGAVEGCGGLAAALAGLLGCPCRVANPFEGMSRRRQPPWRRGRGAVSAWDEPQAGAATAYLPACGLALRSFQP
ncbi:pilus assembly protein PilM [Leptospira sp. 96542]|nr:pilus assembly protein PilM [Leptospira sp. 96542]